MARHDVLILIPARMAATRLPGKPLADIGGKPMIEHVVERARAANLGEVIVGDRFRTDTRSGGKSRPSRADDKHRPCLRVRPHFRGAGNRGFARTIRVVVNVQGDLPTLEPADLRAAVDLLDDPAVDIATLAAEIMKEDERDNPNVVKLVGSAARAPRLRALYFTRATAPYGDGPLYHHIGLYAYRRRRWSALSRCRRRRSKNARSSSSCARSKPACASTPPSSPRCRSASIHPKTSKPPARYPGALSSTSRVKRNGTA